MSDNISRQSALDALKAIRHGLWEIDIPSPAGCPEYVEHHEQIQDMMGVVDGWIKKISEEEPTDRKGHWVGVYEYCHHLTEVTGELYLPSGFRNHDICDQCWQSALEKSDYCPNCGADMRGEQNE